MSFKAFRQLIARTPCFVLPRRNFNLQEYQSKILMTEYDLAVQKFQIATTVSEANNIVSTFQVSCIDYQQPLYSQVCTF